MIDYTLPIMDDTLSTEYYYIATCRENNFKIKIRFTKDNLIYDTDPCYKGTTSYEAFDMFSNRYIYYAYPNNYLMCGLLYYKGEHISDNFEYDVRLTYSEFPLELLDNQLFVYDYDLESYEMWQNKLSNYEINILCPNMEKYFVVDFKEMKKSNNYKAVIEFVDSNSNTKTWVLLLNSLGDILKKSQL